MRFLSCNAGSKQYKQESGSTELYSQTQTDKYHLPQMQCTASYTLCCTQKLMLSVIAAKVVVVLRLSANVDLLNYCQLTSANDDHQFMTLGIHLCQDNNTLR